MPARSPHAGTSDLIALGAALPELRERRGLPQAAVCHDARLTKNYIGMAENGWLNPSFNTLLWIARTLGSEAVELIDLYDRNLRQIDPQAGRWVPACPTPGALAYAKRVSAASVAQSKASKARRTRGRIKPWT